MKSIHKISVNLPQNAYPIFVGADLFQANLLTSYLPGKQVLIVTNQTIAPLYLDKLKNILQDFTCDEIILPDGEKYKTTTTLNKIYNRLLEKNHDRKTTLIALGGGVIGDMAGFAAASYRRGVAYIQYPTTLLAQVDAAIGGKTGVNHRLGKNMIGAIYQPNCVVCDISTLSTLPLREYQSGLAEVIKYGLLADGTFFAWLEQNATQILQRDQTTLSEMIKHCVQIKANIVAQDERENNIRALLNLGHTFAHVLESLTHYKKWLHGEAVAIGLIIAADVSKRHGFIQQCDFERIFNLIKRFGLPTQSTKKFNAKHFFECLFYDKKVLNQNLRLILIRQIGEAFISDDFNPKIVQQTLEEQFN